MSEMTVQPRLGRCARAVAVAAAAALVLVACKKKADRPPQDAQGFQQGQSGAYDPNQPPPAATGPATGPGPAPTTSGTAQPGQVPPLGPVTSDPSALHNIIAGALAGGAASLGAITGGELNVVEQGIKMRADTEAKGMKADGPLMSAKLQQGGHAQAPLTLEPGRCYTIVGFGAPGVFKYQLNLITAPPSPPQVLAQSQADGPAPTVGPNEGCIKNPTPIAMVVNVDMHVLQGQGLVGAQAYKK